MFDKNWTKDGFLKEFKTNKTQNFLAKCPCMTYKLPHESEPGKTY